MRRIEDALLLPRIARVLVSQEERIGEEEGKKGGFLRGNSGRRYVSDSL